MGKHSKQRYWAIKFTAQLMVGAVMAVLCLIVAVAAPGYFGWGGIALPTTALFGMIVFAVIAIRGLFRLSDSYHKQFDDKEDK